MILTIAHVLPMGMNVGNTLTHAAVSRYTEARSRSDTLVSQCVFLLRRLGKDLLRFIARLLVPPLPVLVLGAHRTASCSLACVADNDPRTLGGTRPAESA